MSKPAIVTGGSRGIGAACALSLAKAGYNVAISYLGSEAELSRSQRNAVLMVSKRLRSRQISVRRMTV